MNMLLMCVILCLYKCANEIDVLSTNYIPTWVNKYNGYGYIEGDR